MDQHQTPGHEAWKALCRQPKTTLLKMCREGITGPDGTVQDLAGQDLPHQTKPELASLIVSITHPMPAAGDTMQEVTVPLAHAAARPEDAGELDWQDNALCAQTNPEVFFPEKGGSTREAKRVCRSCEVRSECLDYALENDERFGVWGGLSERERRRVKRQAA